MADTEIAELIRRSMDDLAKNLREARSQHDDRVRKEAHAWDSIGKA